MLSPVPDHNYPLLLGWLLPELNRTPPFHQQVHRPVQALWNPVPL
jgi:hypothetical protein